MAESISIYSEYFPAIAQNLLSHKVITLMLLDVSEFDVIEELYGSQTYNLVRSRLFDTLVEQAGKEFRKEDILALEQPEGLRILLFLGPKRQPSAAWSYKDLDSIRVRMAQSLLPALVRTAFPYLKKPPRIDIGYAMGIHNPLQDPHHIILRAIREAFERAHWQRGTDRLNSMQRLREVIINQQVTTFYQPIVELSDAKPIGYEALSRGSSDSGFQSADELFDAAIRHHLLVELDRICRNRALVRGSHLPAGVKVFINTLPATIRDPEFQGQSLIHLLEQANISPDRIVIEITEKLLIDNLSLFQESMSYFTTLGMSLAVDDVGSGYSGLETISRLKPSYLKLDASLIHDLHSKVVNREMIRAILGLGHGIGARVIAEGIETEAELKALRDIGIDYGQGYLLGRPQAVA
jgi:EAL domain-containing protein (putative c-di-GMP-specific phosphodiesterase class I)